MFDILEEFGEASGLRASRLKSNLLILAGVRDDERASIEEVLGFSLGNFPFRYLGIPLAASRLRGADYSPPVAKISDLLKAWTNLTISYPGWFELIRSVIQGVCCYWLSIFAIPSIIIDRIQRMCHRFL